ncbi:hypothetical protein JEQ12_020015 [Ovis aries]|uniref:KRAB domain-containing protein n=1 Tax=Ovis aries TaxID=9940 RepID=A0A835ZM46_SHEEP|nr:hypothetical protein JEQ12_020015 [Ovis aries]
MGERGRVLSAGWLLLCSLTITEDILGYEVPKPEVIFKLEQGEEPWALKEKALHHSCSDGKFGIKTLQKRISGKVSFHGEMEGEDAKDDSLYSILEVLWQDAEQIKSYQEKQNKPLSHAAFINKKILNTEWDYEYKNSGKFIHPGPNCIPSQKRPHKRNSFGKNLKHNLGVHIHSESSTTNNFDKIIGHSQVFTQSSSYTNHENTHTGVKFCDSNQCGKVFSFKQAVSGTIVVILMAANVEAKIYERCDLAKKLEAAGLNGFNGYTIGDWLCMAHYESGFDTSFMNHNPDGSSEYGIFQLNSAWWCYNGVTPSENLCHMDCHELLNRHILDDIMCAKKVVSSENGMSAWYVHGDGLDPG